MKYLASAKTSLLSLLTYKTNFFISLLSRAIQLGLSFLMWIAIYKSSQETVINGYTQPQMLQYLLLTALLSFVFTFSPLFDLANNIKSGQLNTLLLRPVNIKTNSFAIFLGSSSPFILLVVLMLAVTQLNILITLSLVLYLILSLIVWHELMFIMGTLAFWLIQIWPLRPIISALYMFFGGLLFPLDVLSSTIYQIFRFSPISLVSSDFVELFIKESHNSERFVSYIMTLVIWCVIFKIISNYLFKRGLARFEGVGV